MGYSQYWISTDFDKEDWKTLLALSRQVIEKSRVPLAFDDDEPTKAVELSEECIQFNGIGEDACVVFRLYSHEDEDEKVYFSGISDCKTERRPYDLPATAILFIAGELEPRFFWKSDGDLTDAEFVDAKALAESVIGRPLSISPGKGKMGVNLEKVRADYFRAQAATQVAESISTNERTARPKPRI